MTGASAGIGRAIAVELAARGDDIALLARGHAGLDAAAAEVEEEGVRALPISVDVADAAQVDAAADRVEADLGPIEVWVNCAFTSVFAPVEKIAANEAKRVMEVTYLGYVYGTLAALRQMRGRDRGTIVQVGSALAYRGIPLQSAYCAAKHAIQGFHESLRCELLHEDSGVRTTMVQLPAVNTPQFDWVLARLEHKPQPVPPIYQPSVAARGVAYAIDHPNRRERWIGGSTVATLVANRLAPGLLDRYLGRTGYASQQTAEAQPADAPVNLWDPADETRDFGTAGPFGSRSRAFSPQLWASTHRRGLAAVFAATLAVGAAAVRRATR